MDHHLLPEAANDPVGPDANAHTFRVRLPRGVDPFADLEAAPAAEDCISYAEAQRLLAICREHGDDALTPAQHNAIWDCLLASPASQAWLAEQLKAIQGELQEHGLEP